MITKGDFVNIRDTRDDEFYKCKVMQVKDGQMRIHYVGWSWNYDEWVALDSSRVGGKVLDVTSREPAPVSPGGSLSVAGQSSEGELLGACGGTDGQPDGSMDVHNDKEPFGNCAFCNCKIVAKAIDCRDCSKCFLAVPECVGLREDTIRALLDDSRSAVTYHCIKCRSDVSTDTSLGVNSTAGQSAFNQLIVAVGALCAQVRALTENEHACWCHPAKFLDPCFCSLPHSAS